jgi:hypothetical protein
MASSNSNDGYYEFTNTHSDGSNEKETTTTHTVDELDTKGRHYGIHYISDDSEKKKEKKFRQRFLVAKQGLQTG